ncbi:hypothetical protein R3W88_005608 [Solanum pinnatisectum]|uniref:Pectinesterase inhibitor domain-containing protein n=2 Tax=Solanum TaxID=4107 RepID=A0AAN8YMA3_SOLBU|nr:hypothetical protein R3W88_005608 [Solanum pinnatisectum]
MARTTNSLICIFLIVVFIPEICLGDINLEKTLLLADEVAHKPVFPEDYVECAIALLSQVSADIKLAIKKYHEGQIKQVINQIDDALYEIKSCSDFLIDTPYMFGGPEDIAQLQQLLNKSKKEAFSILVRRSKGLGPALSPA